MSNPSPKTRSSHRRVETASRDELQELRMRPCGDPTSVDNAEVLVDSLTAQKRVEATLDELIDLLASDRHEHGNAGAAGAIL